ncbi:MAG TPA: hypothetical protein VFD82_00125 [Planctomycetota bacterium]|nr:hypothetical protein [Planctomycetota bacterium]
MNRSTAASLTVLFAAIAVAQEGVTLPTSPVLPQTLQEAWQDALTLARTHKAPVLAFVLPPAGEAADQSRSKATRSREMQAGLLNREADDVPPIVTSRDLLLRQVQLLRVGGPPDRRELPPPTQAQAILALTVPVFASAADCGARPGQSVVLLGSDGKHRKGFDVDLLDAEAFVREVGADVLAPEALLARNANVPRELLDLLAERRELQKAPGDETAQARQQQVFARLARALPAIAPALVRREESKLMLDPDLVQLALPNAPLGSTAAPLPGDPCPPCGMAVVPPHLSTVLKLLGP